MVRLTKEEQLRLPKGTVLVVQKAINLKLKEVSKPYDFYGKIGFKESDFQYTFKVFKKKTIVNINGNFKPTGVVNPIKLLTQPDDDWKLIQKLFNTVDMYHYKDIEHTFSFVRGRFRLTFPPITVVFNVKKKKKRKTHNQIAKEIDEGLL